MEKITENYVTVVPAYGRDYKSGKDAKADFLAGKDFSVRHFRLGDGYCSVKDFASGVVVNVRFKGLRNIVGVKVP